MSVDRIENESNIWPVSTEIKVNWGDMDALGHVNHSVFAKWMETVRMMYFSEIGMMNLYDDSNIGPILASTMTPRVYDWLYCKSDHKNYGSEVAKRNRFNLFFRLILKF